jgi:hypothetical protein
MIKHQDGVSTIGNPEPATPKVHHHELYGLRQFKYDWLDNTPSLQPFTRRYLQTLPSISSTRSHWKRTLSAVDQPAGDLSVNSVGIVTAR